jgi:ABC-type nickel/cobalt efflux system permease component RcnA
MIADVRLVRSLRYACVLAAICPCASSAAAHPVPKDNHDRTIVVRLQKSATPSQLRVRVEYRLEVDEETVLLLDMHDYRKEVNFVDYFPHRPMEYYAHFTRIYAPIYADLMTVEVNKKAATLHCVSRKERLQDEDGEPLKHLRCDFVFECEFKIYPSQKTHFFFHDQTYLSAGIVPEKGLLVLSIVNETGLAIESKTEPDATLYKKPMETLTSKEEDRQRIISVVFTPSIVPAPKTTETSPPQIERESHEDRFSLLRLILHTDYGFWLTLLFAFLFGAAHALTPGHGKTLVAAYLVGERGTIRHALFLGLVTTLTHTGVVIILAIIMALLPNDAQRTFQKWIQAGLGLVLGLMVACMGFWLLLQRLAGKADHVHVGGGHHHHHGSAAPEGAPSARSLSWWGLVMLGVTGGIVPCWDAIVLLFYTVGTSRFWLVLPVVLAFSAGLAVVLVLIGVLVVQVPRFVEARGGDGRLLRSLPTVSAIAVILVGLWLCYEWSQGR